MSSYWKHSGVKKKKRSFSYAEQVERRLEHEHSAGRWLLYLQFLLAVVLVVLIGFAVISARNPKNFPLRHVQVVASYAHLRQDDLQKTISPYVNNAGFFSVNAGAVRSAVVGLPWVYNAKINRVWPDKLRIRIFEQKPVAVWNDRSLINAQGDIFTPRITSFPADLPHLYAQNDMAQTTVENYLAVSDILAALNWKITAFGDHSIVAGWHLVIDGGRQIFVGEDNALKNIQKFVKLFPKIAAQKKDKQAYIIDLRYKDGFAIKWKDVPKDDVNSASKVAKVGL